MTSKATVNLVRDIIISMRDNIKSGNTVETNQILETLCNAKTIICELESDIEFVRADMQEKIDSLRLRVNKLVGENNNLEVRLRTAGAEVVEMEQDKQVYRKVCEYLIDNQ